MDLGCGSFEPQRQVSLEEASLAERMAGKPPSEESVSEWADRKRILLPKTSAEPGPWRTDRAPYLRGFMDVFTWPAVEEISFCKSVQVGATEGMYNMMGYAIENAPGPMMLVMPTVDVAVYVSRNRFQPMIEAIDSLVNLKSPDVNEFTLLEMTFLNMVLNLAGANSPASLATKPVRYIFFDETDKYPPFAGREGEPIGLATERARTFWNRKIVKVSTPTTSKGNIWRAYLGSSLRYEYYVPCPFCGHMQTLKFWGDDETQKDYRVKWHEEGEPYEVEEVYYNTWYECPECKGHILDHHKMWMIERGEWRDQYGNALEEHDGLTRSVGFHINALYSPWVLFGEVATKFLKSKDNPEQYMNFVNLWLGLPVKETVSESIPKEVGSYTSLYPSGIVPKDAAVLLATVDVQKYYLQYLIRAWSVTMESWLVKEGQVQDFDDLRAVLIDSTFPVEGSNEKKGVRRIMIDSGYRTDEVYEFVRIYQKVCRASKGSSHPMRAPYLATKIDKYPDGRPMKKGMTLWIYDADYWKDALARRVNLLMDEQEAPRLWHIYQGVSPMYIEQLTAEEKVIVRNRTTGRTSEVWQLRQGKKRNEAFDLEVMNLMLADMVGLRILSVAQARSAFQKAVQVASPRDQSKPAKPKQNKVIRSKWMRTR